MQYYQCKCGNCQAWNSGEVMHDCKGCKECNTTFAQSPSGHKELIPHDFSKIMYNQNTGKPYKMCTRCRDIDDASFKESKIKSN